MEIINFHAQECYLRYRQALDNDSFADLYAALSDIKRRHRSKVLTTGAGDAYDADSTFDDALFSVASKDDVTDVCRLLYVHLRYARIRLYNKNARWRDHVYYPEEYEEFGATVDRVEPDRIGFIRELIVRSGEEVAALITDMALTNGGTESISAISGQVGLHHNTVFRSFKRLRKYYNADMDGNLAEYFAGVS